MCFIYIYTASYRDTEKAKNMVGTLVIQLPSDYEGDGMPSGEGNSVQILWTYSVSSKILLCSVYADCQREVKPVTKGYRLCLI